MAPNSSRPDADAVQATDATPDNDAELVVSPHATAVDLHRIAAERPDLRAAVAAHPAAYPDLLTWLGSWDDPEINAALAGRGGTPATAVLATDTGRDMTATAVLATDTGRDMTATAVPATDTGRDTYAAQDAPTMTLTATTAAGAAQPDSYQPNYGRPTESAAPHGVGYAVAPAAFGPGEPPRRSGSVASSAVLGALIGLIVVLLAVILMLWRPWEDRGTSASPNPVATATNEQSSTGPAAMPFLPAGVSTVSQFTAPSSNIACRTDGPHAFSCTIYEHNITDVDGQGGTCDGPLTYHWPYASEPHFSCDKNPVPKGGATLAYGASAILGEGIGCTSTESGMQCWDGENGRGVSIARRGITDIDKR